MRLRTIYVVALSAGLIGIADVSCRAQCIGPGRTLEGVPGAGFGHCVSALGDINGNGTPDFVVGAPYENGYGTARVYEGEGPNLRFMMRGDGLDDRFGTSFAFGNFVQMGMNTLCVGMPGLNNGTGVAIDYDAEVGGFVTSFGFGVDGFGYCLNSIRVFPDGSTTLAMGSEFGNYVALLHSTGDLVYITHGSNFQGFGRCIAPIADVTGDGIPDVAISAEVEDSLVSSNGGRIYLYSGASLLPDAPPDPQPLWVAGGIVESGRLGHTMIDVGDVNGDGVPDLAAGAPACGNSPCPQGVSGSVGIFSGVNGTRLRTIPSPPGIKRFGQSLALVGDLNGDGHADLAIGCPGGFTDYDSGIPIDRTAGRVVIVSPVDGSVINTTYGVGGGRNFGWSLASSDDLTGDGLPNLVVGAPSFEAPASGRVHVLTNLLKPAPTISVQPSSPCLGNTVVFSATTSLPQPLAYRWFEQLPHSEAPLTPLVNGPTGRGSVISGANTSSLSISGVVATDNGAEYTCVVYDPTLAPADQCASWVVSPAATLQVSLTPTVLISPSPASSCAPNAILVAASDGSCTPATSYSWQYRATLPETTFWMPAINGVNNEFGSPSAMVVAGATSSQIAIIPLAPDTFNSRAIEVRCVGTNAHDSGTSNASRLVWNGTPPAITTQPAAMTLCRVGEATTGIATEGEGLTYRWQMEDALIPNVWHDLSDGVLPPEFQFCGYAAQTQSSVLLLGTYSQCYGPGQPYPSRRVRAIVANGCAAVTSTPASLSICFADLDDGTGEGQCDGGVDINDLLFFLDAFERGSMHADLDDGNGHGGRDQGVDINDLLFFLAHFESGC